jgi:Pentapeptide repeats (8 copies)
LDENHQDNAESKLAAIEDTKWVLNAKNALLIPRHLLIPKRESQWPNTPAKWIELLGTPLTILIAVSGLLWGVYQFNAQQQSDSQKAVQQQQLTRQQEAENTAQALDQQRQTTLDTYLDRMQELFIAKPDSFKAYKPGDEYQALAVARTSTALRSLDGMRKAILIRFLWKAKLINGPRPIVSLNNANLLGANFNSADLSEANLSGALLAGANFVYTDLSGANLSGAWLTCGELEMGKEKCTDLSGANLGCIDLSGGKKVCADLSGAYLMGATMNNKTDLRGTILKKAIYNTKPEQLIGSNGAPFILPPTQWPLGFVLKAKHAGAIICNDCLYRP